jgi:hypothetical protein
MGGSAYAAVTSAAWLPPSGAELISSLQAGAQPPTPLKYKAFSAIVYTEKKIQQEIAAFE